MPHFTHIESLASEIWNLIDFQYGGRCGTIYFQFRTGWGHFLQKVSTPMIARITQSTSRYNYFHFRKIWEKQTSTTLKFYFRFRFRLYHRNRYATMHQAAEFHPNRTTYCRNMTSYRFFKDSGHGCSILLPV